MRTVMALAAPMVPSMVTMAPHRARRGRRHGLYLVGALGVAAVSLVLIAPPAGAHAAFVSSEPGPGSRLTTTPGVVVLRFSEPLITELSGASVVAPAGERFQGRGTSGSAIQVPVATNAPGVYTVEWRTVSPVDGHTLRGRFRFGVGVNPGGGEEGETGLAPSGIELLLAVGRALEYGALLLAGGLLILEGLAARAPPLTWVRLRPQRAARAALIAGLAVVAGEATLAAPTPSLSALSAYLSSGQGGWRLARLAAEAVAAITPRRRGLLAVALAAALGGLAGAGHAAAVTPSWWGVAVDTGHLVAAAVWAGGILGLAVLRPPGGWRGPAGAELLRRFSPVAVPAFFATVGFGTLRGFQELASVGDLVGSSYGRVLAIKVAVVSAMVPLSVRTWRRIIESPRAEAAMAVVAVGAAALLAAYPLPPGRAAEAEEAPAPTTSSALPRPGDLTLGANAGDLLVGLTLRPAQPGRNQLLIHLLPLRGEEDAERLRPTLVVDGTPRKLRVCGLPCRQADADLAGRERVEIRFPNGDTAVFALPVLPAGDGSSLLETLTDRMNRVRTYHQDEVLTPGMPPLRATYDFAVPDRMHLRLATGPETVRIGTTFWWRPTPQAPWEVTQGPPLQLPGHIWDQKDRWAARMVGAEAVDGTATQILAFFADVNGSPIWYRLWVDAERLVHRAEMRARGHFMDHRYSRFDVPVEIAPPTA